LKIFDKAAVKLTTKTRSFSRENNNLLDSHQTRRKTLLTKQYHHSSHKKTKKDTKKSKGSSEIQLSSTTNDNFYDSNACFAMANKQSDKYLFQKSETEDSASSLSAFQTNTVVNETSNRERGQNCISIVVS
jgi:hypothetical protein